jgi:O-antigen/teichoic acid export membrane protein
VFAVEVGHALRVTAPLCLAYPFVLVGLQLAQGSDRLHVYSVTTVFAQALFVVVLAVIVAADWGMSTASALALRGGATLAGAVVLAVWLRPVFRDVRRYVRELFAEAREWGTKVYYGRVLSVGTYNLDVIILGALTDAKSVAFYTLAGAVGYALGLPVTGLSSALFPRMVGAGGLRREWLGLAVGFGALGVAAAWILGPPFISLLFGDSYEDASRYVVPLTLAQSIRGVTTIYNSYFSAQAAGDELRRAAIVLTASNMVLNFALIPPFGAAGAAWASVLALVANLWMHWLGYRGLRARAA